MLADEPPRAQRIYEELLTETVSSPEAIWLKLARAAQVGGNRDRAAQAYWRVYYDFPLSSLASTAGAALVTMSGIEQIRPGNGRYRAEFARAERLFEARRYADARVGFERARPHATDQDRESVALRLAQCDYYRRQYGLARLGLKLYLDQGPNAAEARFFDLMAARALGRDQEFQQLTDAIGSRFPDSVWAERALNELASHFIRRDDDDAADKVFRQMLEIAPEGHFADRAAWQVGWRLYLTGEHDEASTLFEQSVTRLPHSDYRPAFWYWAARSREATGDEATATEHYRRVAVAYRHSYYGRLAEAALAQRGDAIAQPSVVPVRLISGQSEAEAAPNADVIRLLLAYELYDDAMNELQFARAVWGDSPALQASVAWIHYQKGDLRTGINTMKRAYPQYVAPDGEHLPIAIQRVIFPLGYWDLILKNASHYRLDPYLLGSLIAQESSFVPDIRSPANAVGLMQLIPGTARRYAKSLGLLYAPRLLTDPNTNIRMGTAYFADLMKEFGEPHLALASYNAGERRVRRWLVERPGLATDEFIDDIPFPETRNYVKKVLGAAGAYRWLYGHANGVPLDASRAIPSLASRRASARPIQRGQVSAPPRSTAKPRAKPPSTSRPRPKPAPIPPARTKS